MVKHGGKREVAVFELQFACLDFGDIENVVDDGK